MPFFSIVIPTYNRGEQMVATVESVMNQTFPDFELLIIDDGSVDDTLQFLKNNYEENKKAHIYTKQNEERGAARNYGYKRATGRYVCFLDSDDIWLPNHLSTLHRKIKEENFPLLLATKYFWERDGKQIQSDLKLLEEGYHGIKAVIKGNPFSCNFTVKRSKEISPFPEERTISTMEDWVFLIMNLKRNKIYLLDKYTVKMIDHNDRSVANNIHVINARRNAVKFIRDHVEIEKRDLKCIIAFSFLYEAIHYYLADKRLKGLSKWCNAVYMGANDGKTVGVFFRLLMGQRLVRVISNIYNRLR